MHPHAAHDVVGLPAASPVHLPRPAAAGQGPPWAHNSLGSAVHLALAGWYRLASPGRTPEAAGHLLDQVWRNEGFRDVEQAVDWRNRARDMVTRYTATLDPDVDPLGIERTVDTRTSVIAVSGRVDRLDQRLVDGHQELVVVDYKTGRRPLTSCDARSSFSLALYALAVTRTVRRPRRRVELHHLPTDRGGSALPASGVAGLPLVRLRAGLPEGSAAYPPAEPWAALGEFAEAD